MTPGFIDLHSHGGGGLDFATADERLAEAVDTHARRGTTATLLSLVSAPHEVLVDQLDRLAAAASSTPGVLGLHLEGPYLAAARCGAHRPEFLQAPTAGAVRELLDAAQGRLVQVTVAPELPGATDAIAALVAAGVRVAVGHTDADYDQTRAAFDAGASLLTHAFNAMPGLHHRAPGPVLAALETDHVTLEVINDTVHVHPALVRLLFDRAPGRVALVSDAMAGAGSADGTYRLGDQEVRVEAGVARLAGRSTIAGSAITVLDAIRHAVQDVGVDPAVAVDAATRVPAAVIGVDDARGHIEVGAIADIVMVETDWSVGAVWRAGERLV